MYKPSVCRTWKITQSKLEDKYIVARTKREYTKMVIDGLNDAGADVPDELIALYHARTQTQIDAATDILNHDYEGHTIPDLIDTALKRAWSMYWFRDKLILSKQ